MAINDSVTKRNYDSFVEDLLGGTARNVAGNVGTINSGYLLAKGAFQNLELINIFGRNSDIDSDVTFETIWDFGGDYIFPTAAAQLDVQSDNTNDSFPSGTGARQIEIIGLDANYDEITETVDLNGTTTVQTTQSFFRVNRASVVSSGGKTGAAGNITVDSGADTLAFIQPIFNTTLMAVYTVPNNKNAYIVFASARIVAGSASSGPKTGEFFFISTPENQNNIAISVAALSSTGTSDVPLVLDYPIFIPPKTDLRAIFLPTTNNNVVSISSQFILEDISGS